MRIVVDVMGGDHGCGVVIDGVKMALQTNPAITELFLVGHQDEIEAGLKQSRCRDPRLKVVHASEVLTMEDKPLAGIRKKKDSSVVRAVELVAEGKAEALISPGNTGGLVAAATFKLRRLDGVERPAIATIVPAAKREFVLIDAGANPDCKPIHLAQFAIMGNVYSREILGRHKPRVGILSNGKEDIKGNDLTREALKLCQHLDINFVGYVEGHDLFADHVEVAVTDGFVGNLVLKTVESMGRGMLRMVKRELAANPVRKLGAALARNAFRTIKQRMDPEAYGGAPLLGLNGHVIKAHGSSRERAIMNAIRVSTEAIAHHINEMIQQEINQATLRLAQAGRSDRPSGPGMKTLSPKPFKNPRAKHGFQGRTCSIISVGSYVPEKVLTNAELEKLVETSDDWITSRTGIKERHLAAPNEFTSDMAAHAARRAMESGGISPEQIDLIIVATITPDMMFPATACLVQHKIGARRAAAFDIEAACSGFIYGLEIGQQFIMSRTYDTVLVIGAEKLSAIVDWTDRNTCVLFGDGAGAAILQHRPEAHGLLTACMGAEGDKAGLLCMPGGGSRCPATSESVKGRLHYLRMDGKETFKNAVNAMLTAAQEALRRCEISISQIKCVIPHQANRRIIDAVSERLGVKPEQVFVNLHKYGNTSAASVAIALDEAVRSGRIQRGDLVLMIVFGAGLTWAAAVIEW